MSQKITDFISGANFSTCLDTLPGKNTDTVSATGFIIDIDKLQILVGKRVLVVGDVMLDVYLSGDTERISPEAPVPVVKITGEEHRLGGAGNVAANITALGGCATLIGLCGQDKAATDLEHLLHKNGINNSLISSSACKTTVKTRILARKQQMLRMDQESAEDTDAKAQRAALDRLRKEIEEHEAVIFSDYAKGLANPAFCREMSHILEKSSKKPVFLVDPKPAHFPLFAGSYLITPNLKETGESVNMPTNTREEILAAGQEILRKFSCKRLLSTLGPQGMALFASETEVWHIPTAARDVFDVTGAGDTVIATIGLALAAGVPLLEACVLANSAAGIVVGKVGASAASLKSLAEFLAQQREICPTRWL